MPKVKKGDFILLDFTARIKETGEVFDTTREDVAKKEGIYSVDGLYEPLLIIVGEGWVLRGLDEALVGMEIGKESRVEVPPEKGVGPRDPSMVKLYPLRRFKDVAPRPGMRLEVDGRMAIIRAVSAGRVQVDFNPPLAGKTLIYDVSVRKVLRTKLEKLKAIIHRRIPKMDIKEFKLKPSEDSVSIEVPEKAFMMDGLQALKKGIVSDIFKFLPTFKQVNFLEVHKKEVAKPAKPAKKARSRQ